MIWNPTDLVMCIIAAKLYTLKESRCDLENMKNVIQKDDLYIWQILIIQLFWLWIANAHILHPSNSYWSFLFLKNKLIFASCIVKAIFQMLNSSSYFKHSTYYSLDLNYNNKWSDFTLMTFIVNLHIDPQQLLKTL